MTEDLVDHDYINDKINEKIQEAHREILECHNIQSGDIPPLMKQKLDEAQEALVEATTDWVGSTARKLVYQVGGLEVYKTAYGNVELNNTDTGDTVNLTMKEWEGINDEL